MRASWGKGSGVGLCAQLACIWEATARKAGNMRRYCDFDDTTHTEFLLNAAAIALGLTTACHRSVGETVLEAVSRPSDRAKTRRARQIGSLRPRVRVEGVRHCRRKTRRSESADERSIFAAPARNAANHDAVH
jgi:hypothetical protein